MQTKLQELTEKIYNEGVDKAQKEADAIIKAAEKKAQDIESDAVEKAKMIVAEAGKKAEDLKRHVDSELKMSVNQSVSALKQNIANTVSMSAIEPPIRELFSDKDFLKSIIEKVVSGIMGMESTDLKVILPANDQKNLESFFKNQLAAELNKGLDLSFSEGVKSGFKVGPADGAYQVSFTDDDFINFFKSYLRPKSSAILFEK